MENQTLASKIDNSEIIRPFDIPHFSQFFQFSYLPFAKNQFSQFLCPILVTRKFSCSTFEPSLIFKYEMSAAIPKFYCSKP